MTKKAAVLEKKGKTLAEANKKQSYQGDTLRNSQERHQAFTHVAAEWIKKCLTFEQMIAEAKRFQDTCKDVGGLSLSDLKVKDGQVLIQGEAFDLSKQALSQVSAVTRVPAAYLEFLGGEVKDLGLFDSNVNAGFERAKDRATFLRTRKDPATGQRVLRALLSDMYASINNLPLIETLRDLVPGGRVSHLGYDGDTFRANILIPETIRTEQDSDYGGGISVLNNETGKFQYRQRPFVYRHICRNGCVWDRADGTEFRKLHFGKSFDWAEFRQAIVLNLQTQIPLVQQHVDRMLSLKGLPVTQQEIEAAIVYVGQREGMTKKSIRAWNEGFRVELAEAKTAKAILNAFGVVQGLTRAAQSVGLEMQETMETLSARLVEGNWDKLFTAARTLERAEVEAVLVEK